MKLDRYPLDYHNYNYPLPSPNHVMDTLEKAVIDEFGNLTFLLVSDAEVLNIRGEPWWFIAGGNSEDKYSPF